MLESLLLVGIGIALGLGGAVWAGRFVKTVVFGLSPTDVATIGGAVALIAVVSTLAGYLPARRASRVDPMVALHQQQERLRRSSGRDVRLREVAAHEQQ